MAPAPYGVLDRARRQWISPLYEIPEPLDPLGPRFIVSVLAVAVITFVLVAVRKTVAGGTRGVVRVRKFGAVGLTGLSEVAIIQKPRL